MTADFHRLEYEWYNSLVRWARYSWSPHHSYF
jgi:hypothetical protein